MANRLKIHLVSFFGNVVWTSWEWQKKFLKNHLTTIKQVTSTQGWSTPYTKDNLFLIREQLKDQILLQTSSSEFAFQYAADISSLEAVYLRKLQLCGLKIMTPLAGVMNFDYQTWWNRTSFNIFTMLSLFKFYILITPEKYHLHWTPSLFWSGLPLRWRKEGCDLS